MRRRMKIALVGGAVGVVFAFPFLLSQGLFGQFRLRYSPERIQEKIEQIASHNLKDGVAAYWSFDEKEALTPSDGIGVGTISAPGACRQGIRFNGHDDTFFSTRFALRHGGDFSVSFWIKPRQIPLRQDILFHDGPGQIGFRLANASISLDITTTNGILSTSAPFDKFNIFSHVVAVVEPSRNLVSLYLDGRLMAFDHVKGFIPPRGRVNFGRCSIEGKHHPFSGMLDEVAYWDKALSANEVENLSGSPSATRKAVLKKTLNYGIIRYKAFSFLASAMDSVAYIASFSLPRLLRARRTRTSLRRVTLVIDNGPLRRLYRAHARSMASGHRTPAGSHTVQAYAIIDGKAMRCHLSLGGGTLCYPYNDRPAFVLDLPAATNSPASQPHRFLLAPPESSGWLSRLADSVAWDITGLPSPPPRAELVSLGINAHFAGVYILCDASRMLVHAGETQSPLSFKRNKQLVLQRMAELERLAPTEISSRTTAAIQSLFSDDDYRQYEAAMAEAGDVLLHDPRSPLPAGKRAKAIADSLAAVTRRPSAPPGADSFPLDEFLVLGGNPCPWLIVDDIDLSSVRVPAGWKISFRSDSPEWLDSEGHVVKRPDRRPQFVTLAAVIEDASGHVSTRDLSFRIAPVNGKVPALLIWSPIPFGKTHRTDAMVEVFDAGAAPVFRRLFPATAAGGPGGVRYRGNTSFHNEKKLISIKLDAPHRLLSESESRSLLGINAITDFLHVGNTFAFSLFRSFPLPDGTHEIAPHARPLEVFCNGHYYALLEFAERLDPELVSDSDAVVFRHMTTRPRIPFVRQAHPSPASHDAFHIYEDFIALLEAKPSESSVQAVLSSLDLLNVIDYQILYSFLANANGRPYNFWTHDAIVFSPSRKVFLFVPWDFDAARETNLGIVSSNLDKWLESNVPRYREIRLARWRELRRSSLEENTLLSLYDSLMDVHFDYLPTNLRRWSSIEISEKECLKLREARRSFLLTQLQFFDEKFAN